jgi:hypothetical protein
MRNNGVWSETTFPTEDVIKAADKFYLGGSEYNIDVNTYNSLVAQGYGAYVRTE